MSENSKYKKAFIEDELPDLAAVQAAGIELPLADAQLVLMVASRMISHGHSNARSGLYVAARFVNLIVASRVPRPAGDYSRRCSPAPRLLAFRTGRRHSSGWASSHRHLRLVGRVVDVPDVVPLA
jgi:hypothetical protein